MAVNAFNLVAKSSKMSVGPNSFHPTTFSDFFLHCFEQFHKMAIAKPAYIFP